jgi:hypothetical protein
VVTVAVDDGAAMSYLAVTVGRDRGGRLFVTGAPALVGPPATATGASSDAEVEVDDSVLRDVVGRVVRHYVSGDRADLAADLDAGAKVTLPSDRLQVADVLATTWVTRPARVAVTVTARGAGGLLLTLRYELGVVLHGGRWLVSSVHVNPLYREEPR